MHKAFWDCLEVQLKEEPQTYGHCIKLLAEIREVRFKCEVLFLAGSLLPADMIPAVVMYFEKGRGCTASPYQTALSICLPSPSFSHQLSPCPPPDSAVLPAAGPRPPALPYRGGPGCGSDPAAGRERRARHRQTVPVHRRDDGLAVRPLPRRGHQQAEGHHQHRAPAQVSRGTIMSSACGGASVYFWLV